jgi:hypothetical protein
LLKRLAVSQPKVRWSCSGSTHPVGIKRTEAGTVVIAGIPRAWKIREKKETE